MSKPPPSIKQVNRRFILAMYMIIAEKDGKIKYFCEKMDMGHSQISMIKTNKNNVTTEQLIKICYLFGISAEWIITGKGEMYC